MRNVISGLLSGLVASGCAKSPALHPSDELSTEAVRDLIVGVEWRFESRNGEAARRVKDRAAVLIYGDGSFALLGGCNTISGRYALDGNAVYPSGIMSTQVACDGVAQSDTPVGPLQAHRVYADGNRLVIKYDDSVERFAGEFAAPLRNHPILGSWRLAHPAPELVGADISFYFERLRTLSIEVACEDGEWIKQKATFGLDMDGALQLRHLSNHQWHCADTFLDKLDRLPLHVSWDGRTLALRTPDGVLRFIRRP